MLDTNFIGIFFEASLVVQLVMVFLLFASIVSWMFIFKQTGMIRLDLRQVNIFERDFNDNIDFSQLYNSYSKRADKDLKGCRAIFVAGYLEFMRLQRYSSYEPALILEAANRAMRIEMRKSIEKLERGLAVLATIQSTSPYIGLFGTVWGIMHAFRELGNVQQATLNMVAPGISEALIATAMGLIAAIPAGIFYNRLSNRINTIENKLENFIEKLLCLLQRRMYVAADNNLSKDL